MMLVLVVRLFSERREVALVQSVSLPLPQFPLVMNCGLRGNHRVIGREASLAVLAAWQRLDELVAIYGGDQAYSAKCPRLSGDLLLLSLRRRPIERLA